MKNLKLFLGIAAMAAALTISCGPPPDIEVSGITLDKTTLDLIVTRTYTLVPTVSPDNATDKKVTWTSDNENVATVANGVVTAKSKGTAIITATAGNKTITCNVTVDGVLINDVVWATCNVKEAGKFVDNPEDYGNYFTFDDAKNACPAGWCLPTVKEIRTLFDDTKVSTEWVIGDKKGRRFTDIATGKSVFFPAAGYRSSGGQVFHTDVRGYYWSNDEYSAIIPYNLFFDKDKSDIDNEYIKTDGLSVRPVLKK